MEFHMYTTKSIPLLMVVDQQKELKNNMNKRQVLEKKIKDGEIIEQENLWQSLYSLCSVASFGTMNR